MQITSPTVFIMTLYNQQVRTDHINCHKKKKLEAESSVQRLISFFCNEARGVTLFLLL
jgi:hypothetical protein